MILCVQPREGFLVKIAFFSSTFGLSVTALLYTTKHSLTTILQSANNACLYLFSTSKAGGLRWICLFAEWLTIYYTQLEKNQFAATMWWRRAAKQGNKEAIEMLEVLETLTRM
ncbi:MAG: hypothetical protein ACYSSO_14700 [Planctomycetota bacterium]|jgi:hypothetical protein